MTTIDLQEDNFLKWQRIGLLRDLDDNVAQIISQLAENAFCNKSADSYWMRFGPIIARNIFKPGYFLGHDLVSVQPLTKQAGTRIILLKTRLQYDDAAANTHCTKIDYDYELLSGYSDDIAVEITREIIGDLYNNPGITINCNQDELLMTIEKVDSHIADKVNCRATWLVTRPEIICAFRKLSSFRPHDNPDLPMLRSKCSHQKPILKVGTLNEKLAVYEDPLITDTIVGVKNAGCYLYMPYMISGIQPQNTTKCWKTLMHYDKKLISPNYFAKIIIKT